MARTAATPPIISLAMNALIMLSNMLNVSAWKLVLRVRTFFGFIEAARQFRAGKNLLPRDI